MDALIPAPDQLPDLSIELLAEPSFDSPLDINDSCYTASDASVMVYSDAGINNSLLAQNKPLPAFEQAGPSKKILFDPANTTCGIVTCGGLCPGLNDVIRSITLTLLWQYRVKRVLGFPFGYEGLSSNARKAPIELTPESVDEIHHNGGTILGSSRGPQSPADMVANLRKNDVSALFVIGGDGTFSGAHDIAEEAKKQGMTLSVIGIPKTIDNDICFCEVTFGYDTAVEEARRSVYSAHSEAKAAYNGIGLVKLMGRDSGFIAVGATLANSDVNYCLVPEVPFKLDGPEGFLTWLDKRFAKKDHAVVVVAEGASCSNGNCKNAKKDASGNVVYDDVAVALRQIITDHFKSKNEPVTVKLIDPSYTIRSCPANARDSAFCILLGQNAVHAAMAGKTNMFIGYWNSHFIDVPLSAAVGKRKKLDPHGPLWQSVMAITAQGNVSGK